MSRASLVWGSPEWTTGVLVLLALVGLTLLWSYRQSRGSSRVRWACLLLKSLGLAALALSLIEPMLSGVRPRRGANAFVVLADNSQSLQVREAAGAPSRGDWVRDRLRKETPWSTRLGQDFDVRRYVFDTHLRAVDGFDDLTFKGDGSSLNASLGALATRFRGLPLAGVLLFTDGNRTDTGDLDLSTLPPIYPVALPSRGSIRDLGVRQLSVSQTNFESAPVVIRAEVDARGYRNTGVVAVVTDEKGTELTRQELKPSQNEEVLNFRFQFRPERKGVGFYKVNAFAASDKSADREQTAANNTRLIVVDQGSGPYRVLYVSGRPNWEYKFLRRSVEDDEQVQLVGLLRIARRQPKFDFRAAGDRSRSTFYKGFENADADTVESYDQPVLVRLGTRDDAELRDGFPRAADELYTYHAVILDDVEASFFTKDQLTLLRNFVSIRGGGLLMLGGPDSFAEGDYGKTAVGELLPIYLNKRAIRAPADDAEFRLVLTREGWLQPWVRTRKTEDDERKRLAAMTAFQTISQVGDVKPGAVVLAQAADPAGNTSPALVAQQFGKGHVGALMLGDFWRWAMRRADPAETDFDRAWRQTVRWLVGDVPSRLDVSVKPRAESTMPAVEITTRVRDAEFRPLDNAKVTLKLTLPDGEVVSLDTEPDGREAGTYTASYVTREPGAYRIVATATASDGSTVGEREAGWAAQPAADEFARLEPDREALKSLAEATHGEVVDGGRLDAFVAGLSARDAPITEPWTSPLWHNPLYFLIAIACLAGEWGLRRTNGLA